MKVFVILLLILIQTGHSIAQYNTLNDSIINSDDLNFVTLVVDYDTYEFEGGNLSYYQHCNDCTQDSIPFEIYVQYPGDFGSITYNIQNTSETVFDATIIWMGTGQIYHPEDFTSSYPFNPISNVVEKPEHIEYYNIYGTKVYTDTTFIKAADSAWHKIESLEITKLFSENNYKAAIYLYPPSVGVFSPEAAKWIIFLYLDDFNATLYPGSEFENRIFIYPNPCNDYLVIENLPHNNDNFVEILDLSGRSMIKEPTQSNKKEKIDVSRLDSGIYVLKILNNNSIYNSIFIKN